MGMTERKGESPCCHHYMIASGGDHLLTPVPKAPGSTQSSR